MTCNIGKVDKAIRGSIGAVVIALGIMNGNIFIFVVGAIFLFTAISGWCPPYSLLNINTGCKVKEKK